LPYFRAYKLQRILTNDQIQAVNRSSLQEGLALASSYFPGQLSFSSSLGLEDQVLTDAILRNNIAVKIFTIDTGRLFNETYETLERTIARYKKPIQVYFPNAENVENFVRTNGINGFYESVENRKACCHSRKVEPLNRALTGVKIWITGLRGEQSLNRNGMAMIEWDPARKLYKYNPLIHWSEEEVRMYIDQYNVPYNHLHDRNFPSMGCAPCTRAVQPGDDPRSGRWWWETSQKECGLHQTIIKEKS
jgi:phosphoadenosine phosphosulfate reductase